MSYMQILNMHIKKPWSLFIFMIAREKKEARMRYTAYGELCRTYFHIRSSPQYGLDLLLNLQFRFS